MALGLRTRLVVDYYLGGTLHVLLKPIVRLLGIALDRNHSLALCRDITFLKFLGGGSLVIAYPSLLAMRRAGRFNRMRIVATPSTAEFARSLNVFDEIIIIRDNRAASLALDSVRAIWALLRCDLIVDLEIHSRLSTVFCLLTLARNRLGFYTSESIWRNNLSTHLAFLNPSRGVYFFYDHVVSLVRVPHIGMSEARATFLSGLEPLAPGSLPEAAYRIGVAGGCSELSRERMLSPEQWAETIVGRAAGRNGVHVHLLGSKAEAGWNNRLADLLRARRPDITTHLECGSRTLLQSVALISRCDLFLAIDSSLLHYARLLGVPTESWWGPTDPAVLLRPEREGRNIVHYAALPCSPCVHRTRQPPCRGRNLCIQALFDPAVPASGKPWLVVEHELASFHLPQHAEHLAD